MIGETVAHYSITGKLGEGGMGEVYRATDTRLHRDVPIKVLPQSFAQDSEGWPGSIVRRRFWRR
jgi:serine/threonine-protein kinase